MAECAECEAIADCKLAFGIYWREKSNNGVGCETPLKGWPQNWRQKQIKRSEKPAAVKPDARRGRNKLVWQGEF